MNACNLCGAAVRYVRALGGQHIPLDGVPEKRIVIRTDSQGPYSSGEEYCELVDTYTRHDVTCPKANGRQKATAGR